MTNGIRLLNRPWENDFIELAENSKELRFVSPFISSQAFNVISERFLKIQGVTRFKHPLFISGLSDIDAIEAMVNSGTELRSLEQLHAKLYIFDYAAIVTSGNFTFSGLRTNIEYGVIIYDDEYVTRVREDFADMFERGVKISTQRIDVAKRIMKSFSKKRPSIIIDEEEIRTWPLRSDLVLSLRGWMKEVYYVIQSLESDEFDLDTIYRYEAHFRKTYPKNRNIGPKIRQTLQYLRDIGLVEFIDYRGRFRRISPKQKPLLSELVA